MICTRTLLPVGITSITALPSGSVLTSRLPSSLPLRVESKTTAAFMMGLPLNFFDTTTSMWEVAGGGLYLRPRRAEESSCPKADQQETRTRHRTRASWDQTARRDCMLTFYDVRGSCGVAAERRLRLAGSAGLRDFHSHFTWAG